MININGDFGDHLIEVKQPSENGLLSDAFRVTTIEPPIDTRPTIAVALDDDHGFLVSIGDGTQTTDGDPLLRGSAEPNSLVQIVINGQVHATVQSDENGEWSSNLLLLEGENNIVVQVNGEDSLPYHITYTPVAVVEPELPRAPVITEVFANQGQIGDILNGGETDDRTPVLRGTAEPDTRLEVMVNGQIFTHWVPSDGNWTLTVTLQAGHNEIIVSSAGQSTDPFIINYSTASLPKPEITSVWADEHQIGEIANGGSTKDGTPRIHGRALPNSVVEVTVNGQVYTAYTVRNGSWSVEVTLQEGRNEIIASINGQSAEPYIIDYAVPESMKPEIFAAFADENQMGDIANGGSTDDRTPRLSGRGEPNTLLEVSVNGRMYLTLIGNNGLWNLQVRLSDGHNEIIATSMGKSSETFVINFALPEVATPEITYVFADEHQVGDISNGGNTNDRTPQLQGKGEPNSMLQLYVNGELYSLYIGHNGNWNIRITLQDGYNEIVAVSGNKSSEPFIIEYAAPAAPKPTITAAFADEGQIGEIVNGSVTDDRTPRLSGKAEPNANLEVTVNGQVYHTWAGWNGYWSFTVTLSEGHNEIIVSSAGQSSEPFVVDYVAAPTPAKPEITHIFADEGHIGEIFNGGTTNDRTPRISGQAEPNAMLQVMVNGQTVHAKAGWNGHWSINVTLNKGFNMILVSSAGVTSEPLYLTFDPLQSAKPQITNILGNDGDMGEIISGGMTDIQSPRLSGTAEPNSLLELMINGQLHTTMVRSNGYWSLWVNLQEGTNEIVVTSAGQSSDPFVINRRLRQ
ncbi:hypothetical protein HX773_06085 [Pantoea sp. B9002]|uniref:Ig-like domain-containing protein n=1 Tax=Pantoea sp. B9002 TaxID=2726979 RepID=UPI0015A0C7EF|nr:Ig-like domain-containing protein [Pantoea sp. B9002]NWA60461.1 hypothetical protein [Pantoea sp. B9002]